ncbi:hypothetical protein FQN53_002832 [Emmonsiellopsis sp. PD_33]|nr:hypothetical protein FQN53_002832 [Emmonsiellopsis sp. PD_33]
MPLDFSKAFAGLEAPVPEREPCSGGVRVKEVIPDPHPSDPKNTCVRQFRISPSTSIARDIATLPIVRPIEWQDGARNINSDTKRNATVYQSRGQKVYTGKNECVRCGCGYGPFTSCVVARTKDGRYAGKGACANCLWAGNGMECCQRESLEVFGHGLGERKEPPTGQRGLDSISSNPMPPQAKTESAPTRPASPSCQLIGAQDGAATSATSAPPPAPSTPASGNRYMRIPENLDPNNVEEIRHALVELDGIRAQLIRRVELLEAVQRGGWE